MTTNREILFTIKMRNQAKAALQQFGSDMKSVAASVKQATAAANEATKATNALDKGTAKVSTNMGKVAAGMKQAAQATKQVNQEMRTFANTATRTGQLASNMSSAGNSIRTVNQALKDINAALRAFLTTAAQTANLAQRFQGVTTGINASTNALKQATRGANSFMQAAQRAGNVVQNTGRAAGNAGRTAHSGFQAASQGVRGFLENLSSVASAITGISASLAAIGTVRTFADFEKTMDMVASATRGTSEQIAQLSAEARRLGQETGLGATQAAQAMTVFARAGYNTDQIMKATEATIRLAIVGQTDLANAAQITSNVMAAFGIQAAETAKVVDVLTKADNMADVTIETLGESFKYAGAVAKSAGVSINTLSAAFGVLGNAGTRGSLAGTQMQQVISRMLKVTPEVAKALKDMGLTINDLDPTDLAGTFEKLNAAGMNTGQALRIFGEEGGRAAIVISQNVGQLREFDAALRKAGGTAAETTRILQDNLSGDWDKMKSGAQEAAIAIGEGGLGAALRQVVQEVTGVLRQFAQWANTVKLTGSETDTLAATIRNLGIAFAGLSVAGAVASILRLSGVMPMLSGAITLALSVAGKAWTGFNMLFAASPIGAVLTGIVAAIGLVTAALYLLKDVTVSWGDQTFTIGNAVQAVWEKISGSLEAVGQVFTWVWTTARDTFNSVLVAIGTNWDEFATGFTKVVKTLFNAWVAWNLSIKDVFLGVIKIIWDALVNFVEGAIERLGSVINAMKALATGDFTKAAEEMGRAFSTAVDLGIGKNVDELGKKLRENWNTDYVAKWGAVAEATLDSVAKRAAEINQEQRYAEFERNRAIALGRAGVGAVNGTGTAGTGTTGTGTDTSFSASPAGKPSLQESDAMRRFREDFQERLQKLQDEQRMIGMTTRERERLTAQLEIEREARKAGIEDVQKYVDAYMAEYDKLKQLQDAYQANPFNGWRKAVDEFTEDNISYADKMASVWKDALDGVGDALTDLVTKGKADWKSLADSLVQEMTRASIKFLMAKLLQGLGLGDLFGGGGGGGFLGGGGGGSGLFGDLFKGFAGLVQSGGLLGGGRWGGTGASGVRTNAGTSGILSAPSMPAVITGGSGSDSLIGGLGNITGSIGSSSIGSAAQSIGWTTSQIAKTATNALSGATTAVVRSVEAMPQNAIQAMVYDTAVKYGINPRDFMAMAHIESRFNPNAVNGQHDGLFQFSDATAKQYGIFGREFDPAANADAAARLWQDNSKALTQALGRPPEGWENYFAHQQGLGGAKAIMTGDPNGLARDSLNSLPYYRNRPGLADRALTGNGIARDATNQQAMDVWRNKFEKVATQYDKYSNALGKASDATQTFGNQLQQGAQQAQEATKSFTEGTKGAGEAAKSAGEQLSEGASEASTAFKDLGENASKLSGNYANDPLINGSHGRMGDFDARNNFTPAFEGLGPLPKVEVANVPELSQGITAGITGQAGSFMGYGAGEFGSNFGSMGQGLVSNPWGFSSTNMGTMSPFMQGSPLQSGAMPAFGFGDSMNGGGWGLMGASSNFSLGSMGSTPFSFGSMGGWGTSMMQMPDMSGLQVATQQLQTSVQSIATSTGSLSSSLSNIGPQFDMFSQNMMQNVPAINGSLTDLGTQLPASGSMITSSLTDIGSNLNVGAGQLTSGLGTLNSNIMSGASDVSSSLNQLVNSLQMPSGGMGMGLFGMFGALHIGGKVTGHGGLPRSVAPQVFAYAQRYHQGGDVLRRAMGLKRKEVPIIAKEGEHVLTEREAREYRAGKVTGFNASNVGRPSTYDPSYGGGTTEIHIHQNISTPDANSFKKSESQIGFETARSLNTQLRRTGNEHRQLARR